MSAPDRTPELVFVGLLPAARVLRPTSPGEVATSPRTETFNERHALEYGTQPPLYRPSGYTVGSLAGLPRASIATTLAGSTLITQDGRLFALAALVDHAGDAVEVEHVATLVAWVAGARRARRHPEITRSYTAQKVGEVTSGDRQASDAQKEADPVRVLADVIG